MTSKAKYYIWLTLSIGYSSPKIKALNEMYDDIEDFYHSGESEWRLSGILNNKDIESMLSTPISDALYVIDQCNRYGYTVISFDDSSYPQKLYEIYDPPSVLYVWGRLPDFDSRLSIGMIGTRNATAYGKKISHTLSGDLAKAGAIIVSGGAVGIDSSSHLAALEASGVTVCVLGCGLKYRYLMHRQKMREDIAATGAVISEYPPEYPASSYTFPERNRIISGLCDGIVVVEAGEKSGTLITVKYALEQNRDVFAVMGNITSLYSQGTNKLIKDGASPVTDVSDILDAYPRYSLSITEGESEHIVAVIPKRRENINVSDNAKQVYAVINAEPEHIDKLTEKAHLPVNVVLRSLTELELEGLIACDAGRMYRLI